MNNVLILFIISCLHVLCKLQLLPMDEMSCRVYAEPNHRPVAVKSHNNIMRLLIGNLISS